MTTARPFHTSGQVMSSLFRPATRVQTYVNLIYLLLAFPLGTAYFVFLFAGLSAGITLFVTVVGVPILLFVFGVSWGLTAFERALTNRLLGVYIPPVSSRFSSSRGAWHRLRVHLLNRETWTGVLYIFARFPLGIASFVVVGTLLSLTGLLLAAPVVAPFLDYDIGFWRVDTVGEGLVLLIIGIPMGLASLNVINTLAFMWGFFARLMLGPVDTDFVADESTGNQHQPVSETYEHPPNSTGTERLRSSK